MIHWNVSPELLSIGSFSIRWYGLLFAISFVLGFRIVQKMFAAEKVSEKHLDPLFIYMIVGTIGGARVGHCLFYEPEIYLADPIRILKVWEGGLASHGAAIGIFFALFLYCRKHRLSWLWLVDRLCITVALAGGFIRLGNLFNSEILGKPAELPWSFVFTRIDAIPRHPTQLYESLGYFAAFALLYRLYWSGKGKRQGYLFGLFLMLIFGSRFVWEFFKENQVAFESSLPLNMGQLLSVPLVALGAFLFARAARAPQAPGRS
ncbi:MAG: prolipoprotein diacylglyceryl transferase [Oligoflexia bacterium]|nr:prolipoprotein diacylglyceryl transferase [Oligoflexia bacterium]